MIFFKYVGCEFKAYIFHGLKVDLALDFRKANYFLFEGSIEGSIGVAGYLVVLDGLADAMCLLLYFLQALVDLDEGLVFLPFSHAVLAIV